MNAIECADRSAARRDAVRALAQNNSCAGTAGVFFFNLYLYVFWETRRKFGFLLVSETRKITSFLLIRIGEVPHTYRFRKS